MTVEVLMTCDYPGCARTRRDPHMWWESTEEDPTPWRKTKDGRHWCSGHTEADIETAIATMPVIPCRFVGPYYPIGQVDWECATHNVRLHLRDGRRYGARDLRREDFLCPVGDRNTP